MGLVAMATSQFLSSDWSTRSRAYMNTICIRRSIVLRQKDVWKIFIASLTKYKASTLKNAKLCTDSNCSSLQDGQVTISWVRFAKKSRKLPYIEDISSLYKNTSFNDIIRTAMNHGTCNMLRTLSCPSGVRNPKWIDREPLVNIAWCSALFTSFHFSALSSIYKQCPIVQLERSIQ